MLMDGGIALVAFVSSLLYGGPVILENPDREPEKKYVRCDLAVIDERRRIQWVSSGTGEVPGRRNNDYGRNGFSHGNRSDFRRRDYQSRRSGPF